MKPAITIALEAAIQFRLDATTARTPKVRRVARSYMRRFALMWRESLVRSSGAEK